jgi:hypothetical protein
MPPKKILSTKSPTHVTHTELLAVRDHLSSLEQTVDANLKAVVDTLDVIHADTREIRTTLGILVKSSKALVEQMQSVDRRLTEFQTRFNLAK